MVMAQPIEHTTPGGVFVRTYPQAPVFDCASCGATDVGTIRGVCVPCFNKPNRRPTPICKGCCQPIPEGEYWCSNTCYMDTDG